MTRKAYWLGCLPLLVLTLAGGHPVVVADTPDQSWQSFAGLYRPDNADGSQWSCRARDLGQDGGALGIVDGVLYGLENRCDLTAAQAGQGGAVLLTATCDSEGEQVSDMVTLARTSTGITVKRAGRTVQWESCTPAAKPAAHSANNTVNWTATMAQGTIFVTGRGSNSSTIQFSCRDGFDGSLHVDLGGRPAPGGGISFVVDGKVYTFPVWAEGGRVNVECTACSGTFMAL